MARLTMGQQGDIHLPDSIRELYGFTPNTQIRLIETHGGILLIPLINAPASDELKMELEEWQALSMESWENFADSDEKL